ncbi:hypothetical protein ACPR111641_06010 [Acinetobacter pragensis]
MIAPILLLPALSKLKIIFSQVLACLAQPYEFQPFSQRFELF